MAKSTKSTFAIIDWIFDEAPGMYDDTVFDPQPKNLGKFQEQLADVADREEERTGDPRLKRFLRHVLNHTSPDGRNVKSMVSRNNEEWIDEINRRVRRAKNEFDLGVVQQKLDAEGDSYEATSLREVTTSLEEKRVEIAAQTAAEEEQSLEEIAENEFRSRISSASSVAELESIKRDVKDMPTKRARDKIKKEIEERRQELWTG